MYKIQIKKFLLAACMLIIGGCAYLCSVPRVYYTDDTTQNGVARAFDALKWEPNGMVAVTINDNHNKIKPNVLLYPIHNIKGTVISGDNINQYASFAPIDIRTPNNNIAMFFYNYNAYMIISYLENQDPTPLNQSVVDYFGRGNIVYINILNDEYVLSSDDPMAITRACTDIINNGLHQGNFWTKKYRLIRLKNI